MCCAFFPGCIDSTQHEGQTLIVSIEEGDASFHPNTAVLNERQLQGTIAYSRRREPAFWRRPWLGPPPRKRTDSIEYDPRVAKPSSAQASKLVGEVLAVMKQLAAEGMTMVVVTHEMGFAAHVADRVVFMERGEIVASGSPREVFDAPSDPRLASFLQGYRERNSLDF